MKPHLLLTPRLLLMPVVLFCALALPQRTQAKLLLITHGDTISEIGPIKDQKILQSKDPKTGRGVSRVGYMYSYAGVYWLDIWTWGGKWVFYNSKEDKNVYLVKKEEAAQALGVSPDDLSRPFWYRFPSLLMILIIGVALLIPIAMFSKSDEQKLKELLEDPRYQQALNILNRHAQKEAEAQQAREAERKLEVRRAEERGQPLPPEPEEDLQAKENRAWEEAIGSLTSVGVKREEAERNLHTIVIALAAAHAQEEAENAEKAA